MEKDPKKALDEMKKAAEKFKALKNVGRKDSEAIKQLMKQLEATTKELG